jgi:NADP-dependent 3-hydroxy acid dehydrogenase YdfG
VTAGSRGLVAGAKLLVNEGAKVVVAARDEQVLQNQSRTRRHDVAVGLNSDLIDPATAERLTAAAIAPLADLTDAL